ncbi:MAG: DUF6538 domain-containing protein [Bacteroidota bacterium]
MSKKYVYKRGNKFQYRRRVPLHLAELDHRNEVVISLKTCDESEALIRAAIYNDQIEAFWKALIQTGSQENFEEKYQAAVTLAQTHGFAYKTPQEIAASNLNEIVARLKADVNQQVKAESLLGGVGSLEVQLSEALAIYWELVQDRLTNKSEHQIRKWKNPRAAAMKEFIDVVGDLRFQEIDRGKVLVFWNWLNDKIKNGLSPDSANKKLRFVKDVIKVVAQNKEIKLDASALFVETRFQYDVQSRPPFEASFVEDTLIHSLDGLNERDKNVILAMADTGAREVEIFGLTPDDIILEGDIPYIWIRSRPGYALKTKTSERKIPLVGTALMAFKEFPGGFLHEGNPDVFSAIANRYLRENNLRPTPQHTIYSLRHTFKDRLRDIEAPEEIIDGLMGHKKSGPKYGRGHKLETKLRWLNRIAYQPVGLK